MPGSSTVGSGPISFEFDESFRQVLLPIFPSKAAEVKFLMTRSAVRSRCPAQRLQISGFHLKLLGAGVLKLMQF